MRPQEGGKGVSREVRVVVAHLQVRVLVEFLRSGHGGGGSSTSFPAEGKMPFNVNLPVCAWREWNTRYKELVGFRQWLDQFSHWLNLIDTRVSR